MNSAASTAKLSCPFRTGAASKQIYFTLFLVISISLLLIFPAGAQTLIFIPSENIHPSETSGTADTELLSVKPLRRYVQKNNDIKILNVSPDILDNIRLYLSSGSITKDNRVLDLSLSRHMVTVHGNVNYKAPVSGGEQGIRFDGDGAYLTIKSSEAWDFGDKDFTISLWLNFTEKPKLYDGIFSTYTRKADHGYWLYIYHGVIHFGALDIGLVDTGVEPVPGQWMHLAVVRAGDILTIYINGKSSVTKNCSKASFDSSEGVFAIGRLFTSIDGWYFKGYMTGIEVSGTARWTSDFIPPKIVEP